MNRFLLQTTFFAAVAMLSVQAVVAQNGTFIKPTSTRTNALSASAMANAKAMHPPANVPGDGLDGVGMGHDYQYMHGGPDVGYNYYGHPGTGVASSGMYPAPHPTSRVSGHTMYTYQPLMPHEHMYQHKRTYYTPYAGADAFYNDPYACQQRGMGYNKTTVVWQTGSHHFAPSFIGMHALDSMAYKLNNLKYMLPKIGCTNGNCR